MPKIPPLYQQQRQTMGNHTNWQDDKQGSQQDQDQRVKRLARQAGLHTGSMHRQNVSHAMLQLISILSAAQISSANPAITPQRADELSSKNKTQYSGNDSSSATERTVSIHYQSNNLASLNADKSVPAVSLLPSTISMGELNNPSRYETLSAARLKRSTSSLYNIPYDILTVINDTHFDEQLRNTLDNIFRLAEHAPEVRYALKQEKNLYLLLKCIQQLQIFIIKNEHLYNGPGMLAALINLADKLDGPKEKVLVGKFKQQYLSEGAIKKAILMSNSSIYDISQGRDLAGDMIMLSPLAEERINFGEQTRHLSRLLEKNGLAAYKTPPLNRVNSLVDYLSGGVGKERINAVARALLMSSGEYGSEKGEYIPDERKMAVIADYLNHAILGMSLEQWCAKHTQIIKLYDQSRLSNGELERQLNDLINRSTNRGSLSPEARAYYKNNVLKKLLPTLRLRLSLQESEVLRNIDITQPRWGFIHAGAMLLSDSGAGLDGVTLADIEDAGISLHAMLSEGAVAKEYVGYFRLPALLYYAATDLLNLSMMSEQDLQKVFLRYFDYINHWEKKNNPLARLPDLIQGWQTRTGLAREQQTSHGVSDKWLSSYLNSHSEAQ